MKLLGLSTGTTLLLRRRHGKSRLSPVLYNTSVGVSNPNRTEVCARIHTDVVVLCVGSVWLVSAAFFLSTDASAAADEGASAQGAGANLPNGGRMGQLLPVSIRVLHFAVFLSWLRKLLVNTDCG